MSKLGVARLAAAWTAAQEAYDRGGISEREWNSIFAAQRLVDRDPLVLWNFVLEVLSLCPSPEVREILAAGPLEDLIRMFGAEMLTNIEDRARTDSDLRKLLSMVWIGPQLDSVGKRYEELGCIVVAA